MENSEIIGVAVMALAVDQSPDDKALTERFLAALDALDKRATIGYMLAYKLLSGERYGITTDNPERIRRARSIAADLGATIQELEQDDGMTQMVFAPAVKS